MNRARNPEHETQVPTAEIALTTWIIPLMSGVLMALGWILLDRYRIGLTAMDAELAVAFTAALAGVGLATWWFGGVFMMACAATARRCEWGRVERFATRLTPRLIVRTAGAVVGIHLVTVSAAHASEPINPFWSDSETGVSQVDLSAPAASVESKADEPLAPSPEAPSEASVEQVLPGAERTGPLGPSLFPAVPDPLAAADAAVPLDATPAVTAPNRVSDSTVTVVQGDTLWDITAQFLGPHATSSEIAAHTATWLEHNDIQSEGNLIRPGDQLLVPPHLLEIPASSQANEGASS